MSDHFEVHTEKKRISFDDMYLFVFESLVATVLEMILKYF